MKIEKGKFYKCIKTFIMDTGKVAFVEDGIYKSLKDESLKSLLTVNHLISLGVIKEYFIEYNTTATIEDKYIELTTDKVILEVIKDLNSRSVVGINKYGITLESEELSRKEWLIHAYHECLDQANYLKKLILLEK